MSSKDRKIPNPSSKILEDAIIGGAGISPPEDAKPPRGMGVVMLYVPLEHIVGKSLPAIQADLGLPWSTGEGQGIWFNDL